MSIFNRNFLYKSIVFCAQIILASNSSSVFSQTASPDNELPPGAIRDSRDPRIIRFAPQTRNNTSVKNSSSSRINKSDYYINFVKDDVLKIVSPSFKLDLAKVSIDFALSHVEKVEPWILPVRMYVKRMNFLRLNQSCHVNDYLVLEKYPTWIWEGLTNEIDENKVAPSQNNAKRNATELIINGCLVKKLGVNPQFCILSGKLGVNLKSGWSNIILPISDGRKLSLFFSDSKKERLDFPIAFERKTDNDVEITLPKMKFISSWEILSDINEGEDKISKETYESSIETRFSYSEDIQKNVSGNGIKKIDLATREFYFIIKDKSDFPEFVGAHY